MSHFVSTMLQFLLLFIFMCFFYVYECFSVILCMSVNHMYAAPTETRRGYQILRNWSYRWLWDPIWVLGSNAGPVQEQQVLLITEPSLWPLVLCLLLKIEACHSEGACVSASYSSAWLWNILTLTDLLCSSLMFLRHALWFLCMRLGRFPESIQSPVLSPITELPGNN